MDPKWNAFAFTPVPWNGLVLAVILGRHGNGCVHCQSASLGCLAHHRQSTWALQVGVACLICSFTWRAAANRSSHLGSILAPKLCIEALMADTWQRNPPGANRICITLFFAMLVDEEAFGEIAKTGDLGRQHLAALSTTPIKNEANFMRFVDGCVHVLESWLQSLLSGVAQWFGMSWRCPWALLWLTHGIQAQDSNLMPLIDFETQTFEGLLSFAHRGTKFTKGACRLDNGQLAPLRLRLLPNLFALLHSTAHGIRGVWGHACQCSNWQWRWVWHRWP